MAKTHKRQSKKQQSGIPIYRSDGAAVVGRVEGDTFYKSAHSTRHMLTRPRAWACDVDALDRARAAGAAWVEILDHDTGQNWRVELVEFYRRGVALDRGHGAQLALPLAFWNVSGGRVTARPGLDQSAAGPVQMGLGL